MNSIQAQLEVDVVAAMRTHAPELDTLRGLKSALKNEEIVKRGLGMEMSTVDLLQVFRREYKKRQDAAALYTQGGRAELAQKEQAEAKVIQKYLPTAPAEVDVNAEATKLKNELGLLGVSGIGTLTKALVAHYAGSLDGQTASRVAKQVLGV